MNRFLILLIIVFTFTSCYYDTSNSTVNKPNPEKYNNSELENYLKNYGDDIENKYENAINCKCEVSVDKNEFVVDLYNNDLDNCTPKERIAYEQVFSNMRSLFRETHMELKEKVPPLEGIVLNFLEKDGDLITRLTIDLT